MVDDAVITEVPSVRFRPQGWQSGLSRRSTVILPARASIATSTLTGMPSGTPGNGSCAAWITWRPLFSRPIASTIFFSE
jgi:hypothetical protein